jgi:hypothetical protein
LRISLLLLFISISCISISQNISISGNLQDTIAKEPLNNAVIMALRLNDSLLVKYTRSNAEGVFNLSSLPIDTYQVVISHPKFADMVYFIFGEKQNLNYDFGKIIMQAKNVALEEITIYAFKDPIYYKGDTLVYTADSFKTKANATVEDLLKKLPGIKVSLDGKITSQGKKVDKVLVDGDEFFGSDPNVATKNLNANAIESVQVYDKKNDDAATSQTGEETQKVMNLILKDDAKKGYFGKISGAGDFKNYYEGEVLANYFKKKLKVSVFGLVSNTPRSNFGWSDIYKYGLNNETNMTYDEDEEMSYFFGNNSNEGVPKTYRTGFYYSDRLSKNTKIGLNYSYNQNQLIAQSNTNSQYFLSDTTYSTNNQSRNQNTTENHSINFNLEQKIDSLTDLFLISKVNLNSDNIKNNEETNFVDENNIITRNTQVSNNAKTKAQDISNNLKINRKFKKKDRLLVVSYNQSYSKNELDGVLNTIHNYDTAYVEQLTNINQKKINQLENSSHYGSLVYTEPISPKIKLEFSYDYLNHKNKQNKKSLNNIGGEYTELDSTFTNNFNNLKQTHRLGLKFKYEVKKFRLIVGTKARNVDVKNKNLISNQIINQNFNNILPFSNIRYNFSENKQLSFSYKANSTNPTINQLQPIPDNTNPNFIQLGNPNLLPTFSHEFNLNFNNWKPLSGSYTWFGLSYENNSNSFATKTSFDSIGRSVSQTVNLRNGGYNASSYLGTSIPLFSKKLSIEPSLNANYSEYKNFINSLLNTTSNLSFETGLQISVDFDKFSASIMASNDYNLTSSSLNLQSNKPFTQQDLSGNISIDLPKKTEFKTNAVYRINSNRSDGYNINFLVWNAELNKSFLKNENLLIGIMAFDILNQNISVNRSVTANVITDSRINIISRYFLVKLTFKFNSNKAKEEDEY